MTPSQFKSRQNKEMQCDICRQMRPMEKIDDHIIDLSDAVNFSPSYVGAVVSFCLDDPRCRSEAERRVETFKKWLEARHKKNPFSKA